MAINLQKGQKIDIGLTKMTIGLGWDPNEGTGHDFDLDASAFMIDVKRKLVSENHFIFYNNYCGNGIHGRDNPCVNCGEGKYGLIHTGDDPDGKSSDGDDDESIKINLSKVGNEVEEILFVVTIDQFEQRKQNFGQVRNSYIRIVDDVSGEEIAKYELGEDFSIETGVEFGRLYKRNSQWKFEASGIGYKEDLAFFLEKYYDGDIKK
ncbi:MAG: TerD family protein [Bacteroidetes bacterium]|nr:TerD family protein [Bacteroidota bacterium]